MTSLRTTEGMNMERIQHEWGDAAVERILRDAKQFLESGKLNKNEYAVTLTREGKLFADGIAAELFG